MASLTLRSVIGRTLTNNELDANFTSLNADIATRLLASSNLSDLGNVATARSNLGLDSVENKSSATIRGELSSLNVTTALGFTPYSAANPSGFISGISSSMVTTALGFTPYNSTNPSGFISGITSAMVAAALGFTPYSNANPTGYITSAALSPYLTSATAASTYQAALTSGTNIKTVNGQSVLGAGNIQIDGGVTSFNTRTGAVTLSSADVTTALGFTPYNASNPSGYITSSGSISGSAASAPLLSSSGDGWSASTLPTSFPQGMGTAFARPENGWPSYGTVITTRTYAGGGGSLQLYVPYSAGNGGIGLQARFGNYDVNGGNSWTSWKTLLASDNYSSYALPLSGGTLTGNLVVPSADRALEVNISGGVSLYNNEVNAGALGGTGSLYLGYRRTSQVYVRGSNVVLGSDNYSSYALPLSGGALTGSLSIQGSNYINLASATYSNVGVIVGNWSGAGWWGFGSESGHILKFDQVSGNTFLGASDITLKLGTKTVLDSGNFSSYALPLSGGTLSGALNASISSGTYFAGSGSGGDTLGYNASYGVYIGGVNMAGTGGYQYIYSGRGDSSGPIWNKNGTLNTILHAGNYTNYLGDYGVGSYRVIADYASTNTWYIRSNGRFTWARAHDWTQAFELYLGNGTAASNNGWAEFGQRTSNNAAGTWLGTQFVQYTGGTTVDGFVRAGRYYLGDNSNYMLNAGDGSLRVQTVNGYIDIGPKNSSWCHIYSDKDFYTNRGIWIDGSRVLDASNYSSYALPLSGGTVSGTVTMPYLGNGAASLVVNNGGSENWKAIHVAGGNGENGIGYSNTSHSVFGRNNMSFHINASDSFRVHSSGWDTLLEVAGATGDTWIKGSLRSGGKYVADAWVHSDRNFSNGTLIQTDINYAATYGDPFVLEIRGNSYGNIVPFDVQYQGYIYADTIINHGGISNGTSISGLVAINYNGNLCFWFPNQSYWHGYYVRVYVPYASYPRQRVTSITDVAKPTTAKQVDLSANIRQSLHSGNYSNYIPSWSTSPAANTIVYRDSTGDIAAREIVLSSGLSSSVPTVLVSMYPTTNQVVRTTPDAVAWSLNDYVPRNRGFVDGFDFNTYGNYNTNYVSGYISGSANAPSSYSYPYGTVLSFYAHPGQAQFYVSHAGNDLCFRGGWGGSSWQTWNKVLTDRNYSSYALSLNGGAVTGTSLFKSNLGGYSGSLNSPSLQVYSDSNNSAFMSFHRGGYYAVNMGLDQDNVIRIGGWSAPANLFQMDMAGNLTMANNVTAYSDERLKTDWLELPADYVERLAEVKSGTYTRVDNQSRQAGSSAQAWLALLPEVVQVGGDEAKTLSLAYGNAALVSAVELAKKAVAQEARIKRLEELVSRLLES